MYESCTGPVENWELSICKQLNSYVVGGLHMMGKRGHPAELQVRSVAKQQPLSQRRLKKYHNAI